MDTGNETTSRHCRFLNDDYFSQLYNGFIEAFSDYVYPFALTEPQFRNHIVLNAVDLTATVGCVENGKLVGFSLNGFGEWEGKSTVYDAGTGVVPTARRQGISEKMFAMMLHVFREKGIEQYLLEVITTNHAAISLYKKLGFSHGRELALLQRDGRSEGDGLMPSGVEIREIIEPDWKLFVKFWDGQPSWQNSIEAVERSLELKKMSGAFIGDKCVGYIIYSPHFGRVAQIAVSPEHRRVGVGKMLIQKLQDETAAGYSLQIINADKSIASVIGFFSTLGFYERLSQYEMARPL